MTEIERVNFELYETLHQQTMGDDELMASSARCVQAIYPVLMKHLENERDRSPTPGNAVAGMGDAVSKLMISICSSVASVEHLRAFEEILKEMIHFYVEETIKMAKEGKYNDV